jgi:hypothetical protein
MASHERLGEGLAGFETRRGSGRSEQQSAIVDETVGDAQAERQLRPDDGEVDLFSFGERPRRVRIVQVDWGGTGELSDTRISGGGDNFANVSFGGQADHQGVLARTAAENKNSHLINELLRLIGLHEGMQTRGLFR